MNENQVHITVNEYHPTEHTTIKTTVTIGDKVMFHQGGYEVSGVVTGINKTMLTIQVTSDQGVTVVNAEDCYAGDGNIWEDYTPEQYEQALTDNGFTREGAITSYHVVTSLANVTRANFNEGALFDEFVTRRAVLAELVAARHWENGNLVDSDNQDEYIAYGHQPGDDL